MHDSEVNPVVEMQRIIAEAYDQTRRINMQIDVLHELAASVEENLNGLSKWGVRQDIPEELGSITLNGRGDLVKIELRESVISPLKIAKLGRNLVAAIDEAEKV